MSYPSESPEFAKNITMPTIPDELKNNGYVAGDLPEEDDINYIGKHLTNMGDALKGLPSINSTYTHIEGTEYLETPYTDPTANPPRPNKNDMIDRKLSIMGESVSNLYTEVPTTLWNEGNTNPSGYTAKDRSKINNRINRKLTQFGTAVSPFFTYTNEEAWNGFTADQKEKFDNILSRKISIAIDSPGASVPLGIIPNYSITPHYNNTKGYGVLRIPPNEKICLLKYGNTNEYIVVNSGGSSSMIAPLTQSGGSTTLKIASSSNEMDGGCIPGLEGMSGSVHVYAVKSNNNKLAYISGSSYTAGDYVEAYRTFHELSSDIAIYYRRVLATRVMTTRGYQLLGIVQNGDINYLNSLIDKPSDSFESPYALTNYMLYEQKTVSPPTPLVLTVRNILPSLPGMNNPYKANIYVDCNVPTGDYWDVAIGGGDIYVVLSAPLGGMGYAGSGVFNTQDLNYISYSGTDTYNDVVRIIVEWFYDRRID